MEIRQHPSQSMLNASSIITTYYIIVFKNLPFRPTINKREASVFKNLHSRERF